MGFTVQETSKMLEVSRVTIYNKIKTKEMEKYISKSDKGVTYISEEGIEWLKNNINLQVAADEEEEEQTRQNIVSDNLKDDIGNTDTIDYGKEYIEYLKEENKRLWSQVNDLTRMLENSQVLIKNTQEPLQLEEHYKELDYKIEKIKCDLDERKNNSKKSWIENIMYKFKNNNEKDDAL